MDLKKCKILLDAIDYRNLSKVAKDYGYTPSGIWHMIAAIENELGFPLFISSTSGVIPTDNCLRLAPALRELLKCNERLAHTMAEIRGVKSGSLTIGTYPSVSIPMASARYKGLSGRLSRRRDPDTRGHQAGTPGLA
ncbi:MAG: LysR family transcriptional regulator [Synergistaceae bacterium]|nr:LysR family transcriptional regulator [Synergistaceae bacterium]